MFFAKSVLSACHFVPPHARPSNSSSIIQPILAAHETTPPECSRKPHVFTEWNVIVLPPLNMGHSTADILKHCHITLEPHVKLQSLVQRYVYSLPTSHPKLADCSAYTQRNTALPTFAEPFAQHCNPSHLHDLMFVWVLVYVAVIVPSRDSPVKGAFAQHHALSHSHNLMFMWVLVHAAAAVISQDLSIQRCLSEDFRRWCLAPAFQ